MENQNTHQSNSVQFAAAISLTFFWILNILKETYKSAKDPLNFYPPIGPLLGLFISSIVVFIISLIALRFVKVGSQKTAFIVLCVSSILFFFMVFPPFFEPIVDLLK